MASLNLAGKTSGYVKLTAPDDSSTNPTVTLPTESGELALKSDIGEGGDVVAQPPVAFDLGILTDFPIPNKAWTKVSLNNAPVDTESGFDSSANNYIVKKAGIYELNWDVQLTNGTGSLVRSMSDVKVNGASLGAASDGFYSSTNKLHTSLSRTKIVELDVGDEIELFAFAEYTTGDCNARPAGVNLSGHMVSSITEGEVKEKEAVVFKAGINTDINPEVNTWTPVVLNKIIDDTDSNNSLSDGKFKPSISGWYQVNAGIHGSSSVGTPTQTLSAIYKNGSVVKVGSAVSTTESSSRSNGSDIIYLDSDKGDYLELYAYITCSGVPTIKEVNSGTHLSAHLITGQSSGGGSGSGGDSAKIKALEARLDKLEKKLKK